LGDQRGAKRLPEPGRFVTAAIQLPAKVTNTEEKFKDTSVHTTGNATPEQIKCIELGGSKIRLDSEK
jgi:hypothetical protein